MQDPVSVPSGWSYNVTFCPGKLCFIICSVVLFQFCATSGLSSKSLLCFFGFEPFLLNLYSWSRPHAIIFLNVCLIIISPCYFFSMGVFTWQMTMSVWSKPSSLETVMWERQMTPLFPFSIDCVYFYMALSKIRTAVTFMGPGVCLWWKQ